MSFLLKPFQRKTALKASKLRRASISGGSPNESFVLRTHGSVYEANEDDTTMSIDASTSTGYGKERMGTSGQRKHHIKSSNKKPKTPARRESVGNNKNQGKDKDGRRATTKSDAEEKSVSVLNELAQFEEFVKKVSVSQKGEKLLKDHLMKRQTAKGGR